MNIQAFSATLARQIEATRPTARLLTEAAFERVCIIGPAWELSRRHPDIRVFSHPSNLKKTCTPTCESAASVFDNRVQGCPKCWARSKALSVVDAFGMRNNFDLVAVDRRKATLAVEVKWLSLLAAKGPNAEFQRFMGQCALAAATNDVVIGVCGFRGQRKKQFDLHEDKVRAVLRKLGVRLIALRADS